MAETPLSPTRIFLNPAFNRQGPLVTDGRRGIFTGSPAPQSKAGDFNTPHGLSLLRHSFKVVDVEISSQPHGGSVMALSLYNMKCFFNLLTTKLFDQLTTSCPKDHL